MDFFFVVVVTEYSEPFKTVPQMWGIYSGPVQPLIVLTKKPFWP